MTNFGSGIGLYSRRTRLAILKLTVPATIISSACRGGARNAPAPIRSTACRLDRGSFRRNTAHPVDVATLPQIGKTDQQDSEKDEDVPEGEPTQLPGGLGIDRLLGGHCLSRRLDAGSRGEIARDQFGRDFR